MFKRANKVTALLVAAASVMSIVPAMAATRLGTKDGHIKGGAIAFEDGKYIFDGYRTNDDDTGIYYNNGSEEKEKFNEDLRDYGLTKYSKYGTKYAFGSNNDGKDQYLIDLSTGKIVDDETPEDKADGIKSKLKASLKKTNRYSTTGSWDTVDLGDSFEDETGYNDYTRAFRGQFGDVWYKYTAAGDVAGAERKASFTIKLPATAQNIGGIAYNPANKAAFVSALKLDPVVTAIYDSTSIGLNADGSLVTGYAKTVGEKTKAELGAFATQFGVKLLGEVTSTTVSAVSLNLGTLSSTSAKSNNAALLTRVTTSSEVELLSAGINKAATATVTVTDANGHVATLTVDVTSTNGVSITDTKKYFTEAQKAAAVSALSTSGSLYAASSAELFASFEVLGLDKYVYVNTGVVDNTKLTVEEARDAIIVYLQTGKKGLDVVTANGYVLNQDVINEILKNALAKKVANNTIVTVDRGANPVAYSGFVNESGKYVDASHLANVYIYSHDKGKTVKIAEYNKRNADYGITVSIQDITAIAQDKDYIYTLTKVGVLEDTLPNPEVVTQYFIQKISKAQGDTKDGAYVPKSVDSYQLNDAEAIYKNGDSKDASELIRNIADTRTVARDGFTTAAVRVKDGSLYVTGIKNDGDKDVVKVWKVVLKKDKIDSQFGREDVDVYLAKVDGDASVDIRENTRNTAVSYDVDGNTWVVSKGTVYKFDGKDKKEVYTCDRTFDHIDAYDEKNLIVWGDDSEVYSNVGEGTKKTQEESTAVAPVIVTGWVKGTDGTWTFNDAAGTKVVSKWINVGGAWYYLKADGIMATGWYNDNGTWYYLQGSGAMATGWLNDNGTWYYLAGSGAMLSNTVVDGYTLGASGAWVK